MVFPGFLVSKVRGLGWTREEAAQWTSEGLAGRPEAELS